MYCINFIDLKGLSSIGRNWDSRLLSGTVTQRKIFISCFGKPTRQKQNNTTVNSPESFLSEEPFCVSVSTCRLTLAEPQGKKGQAARKILLPLRAYPYRQLYTMRMQSARALSPLCVLRGDTAPSAQPGWGCSEQRRILLRGEGPAGSAG